MKEAKQFFGKTLKKAGEHKAQLYQILISLQILYELICVIEMGSIYLHPLRLIYKIGTLLPALFLTLHF